MSLDNIRLRRRDLIKIMGTGAASVYLGGCVSSSGHIPMSSGLGTGLGILDRVGPFDRSLGDVAPREFSGDQPSLAHKILWNKLSFMDTLSGKDLVPTEKVKVVVVGGGMSGLLTSYRLRHHQPLILEQAPRFGGNSRGESWQGIDYSLGAAYFDVPAKGGAIDILFKEIGVDGRYRIHDGEDDVYIKGKKYQKIWENGTHSKNRHQFRKLSAHFTDVAQNKNGKLYPHIPIIDEKDRSYIENLDTMNFKQYCEKIVGGTLDPHVEEVIENYFWSACAASSTEWSAAGGLNFFAGDFDKIAVMPGGNGALAEALLTRLYLELPKQNMRAASLVFNLKIVDDGAHVSYLDGDNKVHTVHASTVVMSCPKFIAAKIIDGLEPKRLEDIGNMRYRSYLLANLLLNQHVDDRFYDLYFFKDDKENLRDLEKTADKQKVTDVVYGSYAKPDSGRTILSVYRGFPYDGARQDLLAPESYEKYRKEFEEQIFTDILPLLGVKKENVVDLRLARWGHPMPVCEVGNIKSGRIERLRKPFKERVFFVEQDNWTLPAFETTFYESQTFSKQIEDYLKRV